jgi:hypothetical protein
MIRVRGSARRFFTFSADLPMAYAYYSDVSRLLSYLPHISLVQAYGPDRFRLLYNTTELGTYHVRIFADVEATLGEQWILRVRSLSGFAPVKPHASLGTTTAQGHFTSRSVFSDAGDKTKVEYQLELEADLPTPYGLRFMPGVMVNRIAKSITKMRTREIVDGFIERSVAAYPHWLAEMEAHGSQHQDSIPPASS